jgi:hypothetical protein
VNSALQKKNGWLRYDCRENSRKESALQCINYICAALQWVFNQLIKQAPFSFYLTNKKKGFFVMSKSLLMIKTLKKSARLIWMMKNELKL